MSIGPENFLAALAIATILLLAALAVLTMSSRAPKEQPRDLWMRWSGFCIQLSATILLWCAIGLFVVVFASCEKIITPGKEVSTTDEQASTPMRKGDRE